MTTVGYGDKSPITAAGRLVALVWMFSSIIIISLITGAFATAMTVHQLTPRDRSDFAGLYPNTGLGCGRCQVSCGPLRAVGRIGCR